MRALTCANGAPDVGNSCCSSVARQCRAQLPALIQRAHKGETGVLLYRLELIYACHDAGNWSIGGLIEQRNVPRATGQQNTARRMIRYACPRTAARCLSALHAAYSAFNTFETVSFVKPVTVAYRLRSTSPCPCPALSVSSLFSVITRSRL